MIQTADEQRPRADAVRVVVVDSARSGVAYPRLSDCLDIDVIGQVPWLDARFLLSDFVKEADVVIVGLDAAELAEADVQAQMLRLARRTRVMAVVSGVLDAELGAELGIRGLVAREVEPAAIGRVVRAVAAGEIAYPRSTLAALLQLIGRLPVPLRSPSASPLTPRQREVVALIAAGATDREVALRLRISESTAHKHVQNALRRSRAKTRSQLVALVRQESPTPA